ncbi:MAG: MFS transporter [Paracoccaceae bacterium]
MVVASNAAQNKLTFLVCLVSVLAMLSFALWPVFLTELGVIWQLNNTELGLIGGAYFFGYVIATPFLVSSTDIWDAKKVFITGSLISFLGCCAFSIFASGFWNALIIWGFVGAGLAGTYMPGLQILNARLEAEMRVKVVPWYTSCFGIGTGLSYYFMSYNLTNFDAQTAAALAALGPLSAALITLFFIPSKNPMAGRKPKRKLLNFKPALSQRRTVAYIFCYGAHNFELFAFQSWIFALLIFLQSQNSGFFSINSAGALVTIMTLIGVIVSILGAKLCLHFNRNRVIGIIGLGATLLAILSALVLQGPLWPAILLLLLYYMAVMMDSGALTAGVVKESDDQNRVSILVAYSMFGFIGSIIGPPMVGFILDWSGGLESYAAWKWGLIAMAAGSFAVFIVQNTLSKTDR